METMFSLSDSLVLVFEKVNKSTITNQLYELVNRHMTYAYYNVTMRHRANSHGEAPIYIRKSYEAGNRWAHVC